MNRLMALLVLLSSVWAWSEEPEPETQDPETASGLEYKAGGPATVGDPIRVSNLTPVHDETDLVVRTGIGDFALTRKFSYGTWTDSRSKLWKNRPSWFAPDAADGGVETTTEWWSPMESYATLTITVGHVGGEPELPTASIQVRDLSGDLVNTEDLMEVGGPGFAPASGGARLEFEYSSAVSHAVRDIEHITLVRPGVGRFRYSRSEESVHYWTSIHTTTTRRFRLTGIFPDGYATDGGSRTPICTVTRDGATCFGGQTVTWTRGGGSATPSQVTSVSLNNVEVLRFGYTWDHRLETVEHVLTGQTTRYDYDGHFQVVSQVSGESRTLFTKAWGGSIVRCGELPGQPNVSSTAMSGESTPSGGFTYAPEYQAGETCFGAGDPRKTSASNAALSGEVVKQTFTTSGGSTSAVNLTCQAGGNACSMVSDVSASWSVNHDPWVDPTDFWRRDYRGSHTVLTQHTSETGAYVPFIEVTKVEAGAIDSSGMGALSTTNYTWQYAHAGETHQRLPETESIASVLQSGGTSTTRFRYDLTTKQLKAVIKTGWTRTVTGTLVQKHVATFMFDRHVCSQSSTPDPHGRVLETHGPCFVQSVNSTDCDVVSTPVRSVPVTQFEYWPQTEPDGKGGRLKEKRVLVGGEGDPLCGSRTLVTRYARYDARGNVLEERDPNDTVTTRVFTGDRLMSETVTSGHGEARTATTRYFYHPSQGGRLSAKQFPSGEWEVYCWRLNADASCRSGGTPADQLQWQARLNTVVQGPGEPANFASDILEKTIFTYTPRPGAIGNAGGGLLTREAAYGYTMVGGVPVCRQRLG